MFLFDTNNERNIFNNNSNNDTTTPNTKTKRGNNKSKKSRNSNTVEAKAAAKAKKIQQDDMDALQITFYEIESWIEKTSPVLTRMTKELDKASRHFEKRKRMLPPTTTDTPIKREQDDLLQQQQQLINNRFSLSPSPPRDYSIPVTTTTTTTTIDDDLSSMQWTLSFQPGNSMRLETNIKSVEQLIDAVQKIRLITESTDTTPITSPLTTTIIVPELYNDDLYEQESEYTSSTSSISSNSVVVVDPSIEYWNIAMYRRPTSCLEKYKDKYMEMNLNRLTEDVSPSVLSYICQTYWDCLHPKFSADWTTFWDRSGDPKRNQVCIDSGLAMVFLHIIRHNKNACANAHAIAYYYYDRAREALMDYFDSPDAATIETLLNLAMFCVLCKKTSQSRIYIGLAYRMMNQLNINKFCCTKKFNKTASGLDRKKYLKLYMVLYYNDVMISVYSGEPALLDDSVCEIDFYEMLQLNQELIESGQVNYDDKTLAKESFFVHILELAKIGKKINNLTTEYQRQNLQHHHSGTLPPRWVKKVQELEILLATWFDKLPLMYRVDPKPTSSAVPRIFSSEKKVHDHHAIVDAQKLQEQSALLLMLQYQTQWIQLHKTFLSPNINKFTTATTSGYYGENDATTPSNTTLPYRTNRSYDICTDAANRIVIMSEVITERYDWCVCQQYVNCVYQASTVFCKSIINKDASYEASKAMIHRITSVLAASKINYQGLPVDLTDCLNDFLAENGGGGGGDSGSSTNEPSVQVVDQLFSSNIEQHTVIYNDEMFNSPYMYKQCMNQQQLNTKPPLNTTYKQGPPSEAMYSIKIQNTSVVPMMDSLEPDNKNWRCKFSSSNIAHVM